MDPALALLQPPAPYFASQNPFLQQHLAQLTNNTTAGAKHGFPAEHGDQKHAALPLRAGGADKTGRTKGCNTPNENGDAGQMLVGKAEPSLMKSA